MIKKLLLIGALGVTLSGCFMAPLALLSPAASGFSTASLIQSGISSGANYMVKKSTGKSPLEHAVAYAEKNNPTRKKEKCVEFLEASTSEVCAIAKQKVAKIKSQIYERSKIEDLAKKSGLVRR